MTFATITQEDTTIIRVPARFDFSLMRDFDGAMDHAVNRLPGSEIVVDLAATRYVDSAGMGMLLVLRDRARSSGKTVVLSGAGGTVSEVLKVANFAKLFAFR